MNMEKNTTVKHFHQTQIRKGGNLHAAKTQIRLALFVSHCKVQGEAGAKLAVATGSFSRSAFNVEFVETPGTSRGIKISEKQEFREANMVGTKSDAV